MGAKNRVGNWLLNQPASYIHRLAELIIRNDSDLMTECVTHLAKTTQWLILCEY